MHWGHFVYVPLASSYHTALPVSPSLNCPEVAKGEKPLRRPSSATQSHENKHKVSHQVTRPSYLSFWWSPYQGWRQCWILTDPRGWNPQTERNTVRYMSSLMQVLTKLRWHSVWSSVQADWLQLKTFSTATHDTWLLWKPRDTRYTCGQHLQFRAQPLAPLSDSALYSEPLLSSYFHGTSKEPLYRKPAGEQHPCPALRETECPRS